MKRTGFSIPHAILFPWLTYQNAGAAEPELGCSLVQSESTPAQALPRGKGHLVAAEFIDTCCVDRHECEKFFKGEINLSQVDYLRQKGGIRAAAFIPFDPIRQ